MNNNIYPWQKVMWGRFYDMRDRMPHAILLHGRQGIGKLAFAKSLAFGLLCESPDRHGNACGNCLSCGWLKQDNHPDFRLLEPEESDASDTGEASEEAMAPTKSRKKSRFIVVDQIRALHDLVGLSTHRDGLRIVVLHPAEALNPSAANALLKLLEEPPPATLFLLVTHQMQRLLPTIRSRCHKIAMQMPSAQDAQAWLSLQGIANPAFALAHSGGAPVAALDSSMSATSENVETFARQLSAAGKIDPFASAAQWNKENFGMAVAALQKWCYDLASMKLTGRMRYFPSLLSSLQEIVKSVDLRQLIDFQRKLVEARAQAAHPLNTELQLEALLVSYSQLFAGSART